jgi:hypothetical protein
MAKGIRDLTPISEGGRHVTAETLFEGVTPYLDASGIYARKVRADEIEAFVAREDGPLPVFVLEHVEAERVRAVEREDAIEADAAALVVEERDRAELIEAGLEKYKSDKATGGGTARLMDATVGTNINYIGFDTTVSPVLQDSYIQCTGGTFRVEGTIFKFQPASGDPAIIFYQGGTWQQPATGLFEYPNLTVEASVNANGGVWEGKYGCYLLDLQQLRALLHEEVVVEKTRAEQQEALITQAMPTEIASAIGVHNVATDTHEDIRATIPSTNVPNGKYNVAVSTDGSGNKEVNYEFVTLPDAPAATGQYVLDIATGGPAFEPFPLPAQPADEGNYVLAVDDTQNAVFAPFPLPAQPADEGNYVLAVDDTAAAAFAPFPLPPKPESEGDYILHVNQNDEADFRAFPLPERPTDTGMYILDVDDQEEANFAPFPLPAQPADEGNYVLAVDDTQNAVFSPFTLPNAPTADGEYKLVVSGGIITWELI